VKKAGTGDASTVMTSHYSYKNLWNMGKLAVPKEHTRTFLKAYMSDFLNGWFGAFTENPGEGCMPLYFDYDLWSREYPTEEFWKQMEALEKEETLKFFPGRVSSDPIFTSTVATAGVIDVCKDDGTRWYKCGIHVYYPRLFVNVDMALYISTAVLAAAEKAWPLSDMTWDKQIDRGVYGAARGLRMVYMFKAKPCPRCSVAETSAGGGKTKSYRGERCDTCDGVRVVSDTSASMYSPLYRVDGGRVRTAILPPCRSHPTLDLMMECSLRAVYTPEPVEGFVVYTGAIPIPHLKTPLRVGDKALTCSGDAQIATAIKNAQEVIVRDTPRWTVLQQTVHRVNPMYQSLEIRSALKMKFRNTTYKVCQKWWDACMFVHVFCLYLYRCT